MGALERVAAEVVDVVDVVSAPPGPALAADALERLPGDSDTDPYWRLVAAFLVGYPPHSSRAYFGDLKAWYAWCAQFGVHPPWLPAATTSTPGSATSARSTSRRRDGPPRASRRRRSGAQDPRTPRCGEPLARRVRSSGMGESDVAPTPGYRGVLRSDAERRGWRCVEVVVDTMGGDYLHIEVRNRHGYVLARGRGISISAYNPDFEKVEDLDWDAEIDLALRAARSAEERREARRLPTRLRRARTALEGSVDVPVPDPKREPRPPRDSRLEGYLRKDRGLNRRQAREVARQIQAGTDEEDALGQIGVVTRY